MLRKLTLLRVAAMVLIMVDGGCRRAVVSPQTKREPAPSSKRDQSEVTNASGITTTQDRPPLVVPDVLSEQSLVGPLADAYNRIDPGSDGWASEAFGEAANHQLKKLAQQFTAAQPKVDSIVTEDFSSPELFTVGNLATCFQDHGVTVRRSESTEKHQERPTARVQGPQHMSQMIAQLQKMLVSDQHVKFKIYRVESLEDHVETKAYFHADGATDTGRMEMSADWTLVWDSPTNEAAMNTSAEASTTHPKLRSIRVENMEVVETNVSNSSSSASMNKTSPPLFTDLTSAVLGGEEAFEKQLRFGTDHWRARLCRDYGLDVVANHGIAIGDVNGDMLEDLYVCQQGGLPNRLFLQQRDGRLKDVSEASGTDWLNYSASALLVDLDNDGDKDLAVAHEVHLLLMKNDGTGSFYVEQVAPCQAQTFSLAAADYDLDGDLDIYCCGYNRQAASVRAGAMGSPLPYHDAQNGGANTLLRNDGNWKFVNATAETGLNQNNNRFSFAASWEDYDNDGDVDLYVSNDYGRNNLYRNDQGRFTDVAGELNVEDMSAGMSVSWADANRDGWMDFYVSNMFSAAGNRITYQRQFKDAVTGEVKKQYQRHARGNSLFLADGDGGFRDASESAGVTMGRWAWGSKFCDFNNDGWHDIFVNNGFITTEDTGDL